MFSVRHLTRLGLRLGLVLIVISGAAWCQATIAVEQQFAAYHHMLNGVADNLLTLPPQNSDLLAENMVAHAPAAPSNNDAFNSALGRVQQLRSLLEPILREQGVPEDLAAIVLVESGGRATALSPKGARGLWQLMPETARRYGLTVSTERDERTDVIKATRAAARYLRDLYAQFGDWQLAFAAYNAGEQTVKRALLRAGSGTFQQINAFLPSETRAYVPAVTTARPLFGQSPDRNRDTLQSARAAHVLYASAAITN